MLLLTGVSPDGSYAGAVLPGGVLTTFALGIGLVASTIAAVQGVPPAQSGLASGLLNTARLMGGALGLAILGTIAANHTKAVAGTTGSLQALTDGYGLAYTVAAGFTAVAGLVALFLLGGRPAQAEPVIADADAEPVAA
jgi:sugar phosphate permease